MRKLIRAANHHRYWNRQVRFQKYLLQVPSFDRWLYVKLHALRVMGGEELGFLSSHVKPGMTVIDIGANIGLYSLILADLVGSAGRVHSFEPSPGLFAAALKNSQTNGRDGVLRIENIALGSRAGEATLYEAGFNSGDNRMVTSRSHKVGFPVRILPLDEVLPGVRVDWIKMDTQGWEAEVLRGMRETLRRNPDVRVYFEYWPAGLRHAGEKASAPLEILEGYGMSIFRPEVDSALSREELRRLEDGKGYTNLVAYRRGS
jgi:FkbM family methyltransferase